MIISLTEYAKIHGKSPDTIRRMAENGLLRTARKVGRNWTVDENESYPVAKRTVSKERSSISPVTVAKTDNQQVGLIDLQADFYRYMVTHGGIAPKTSRDYISRLRFLASMYAIDSTLTTDRIEDIMRQEERKRLERDKYSSKKAMTDFQSGLRKFLAFIESDYERLCEDEIEKEVKKIKVSQDLTTTEKESIVQARVGQGSFRRNLVEYWEKCIITGCNMKKILIASHIKPWRDSTNIERLDYYNGLLLLPHYDKLFDLGYMTINLDGNVLFSKFLSDDNKTLFKVADCLKININEQHKGYLEYHNKNCFMG